MSTDGTRMFPDNADDLLAPYSNEIFIRLGMAFGGGSFEYVSLGYFRISSVEQAQAPNGPISIAAQDRMAGIVEARLLQPIQFPSTETYGAVVSELVQEVYPWATIQWDDLTYTDALGRSVIAEEDRYKFLNELVTALGKIWYWDHRGVLIIKDTPAEDDPVWHVNAGENGVLVELSRDLSRDGVYNAIVVSGEALDTVTPARAVAVDDNPDSPTYWYGDFGKVPTFYNSSFITTVNQAQTAANALLNRKLGLPYAVDFRAIKNPAIEPYDPVVVNLAGTAAVDPAVLVKDYFDRTVSDSWGVADSGETWIPASGSFDVAGGAGTITIPTLNVAQSIVVDGVNQTDVEGYFLVSVPNAATGAALLAGAVTRYSTGNGYQLRIEFRPDGLIGCKFSKFVSGSFSEISANNPVPGLTYTAGQVWRVKFRNYGDQLKVKLWIDGEAEPTSWTLIATDTSHLSGSVGIWSWRLSGNTNTGVQMNIHEYVAQTYPGHAAGSELHVIEKLTVPLTNLQPMTATTREQTLIVIGEV